MTSNNKPDTLTRSINKAIAVVACIMVVYHLVATQYMLWGDYEHQSAHLGMALALVFLSTMKTMRRRRLLPLLAVLLLGGLFATIYVIIQVDYLLSTIGFINTVLDWVVGVLLIILTIEATREAWGWPMPLITIIFIVYFLLGQYLPYPFYHRAYTMDFIISNLSIAGVYGNILAVSANYVFLFVIFGALMGTSGADRFLIQAGRAAGRFLAGGPAQTSVISSAMVGMVMGQAVTNVAVTGSFTIPMMKKAGYTPDQAGAVEAAASTAGQFTPPVMGNAAFLMANLLAIDYFVICLAAAIPSALYYITVGIGVQIMAYKNKIQRPIDKVDIKELAKSAPAFIVPLAVIVILLAMRFTPMFAVFYTIAAQFVVTLITRHTRAFLAAQFQGLVQGAVAGAKLGVSLAMIGIMVKSVTTTGLGITISSVVEGISGGSLLLALFMTMVISLFLGAGLPTIAAYLLVAVIVSPVLVHMGVAPLAAHFFVFWFAVFSAITPPVAFASMAGAAMAGGGLAKTSLEALRLAVPGFLLAYIFVFNPILLLQPQAPGEATAVIVATLFTCTCLAVLLYRHLFVRSSLWETGLFGLAGAGLVIFLFAKVYVFFIGGLLLFLPLIFWQWERRRKLSGIRIADLPKPESP